MDGHSRITDEYLPLSLSVPEPQSRPGEEPDFSHVDIGEAGKVARPEISLTADDSLPFTRDLIRVLDMEGKAHGPWAASVSPDVKRKGLETMIRVRAFDARMMKAQRQGKTSFYIQCLGEEAIATAHQLALRPGDMNFPSYRQVGILMSQDYPVVDLMNQIYSNEKDPLKGRQLPIMYSSREHGFFTISGNLATQWPQAVGWAMASAIKGDTKLSVAWIGDGATAEGDWHTGMVFAGVYRPPVILNIVNNQWAISSFQGIAGGLGATFASRGLGYGIPGLRVDGNDFLACHAVAQWAAERARRGQGPVLVEYLSYRKGAHSTSDDPSAYRPKDEADKWPLGDPIDRLKDHMVKEGHMSTDEIAELEGKAEQEMREAEQAAEANGLVSEGNGASARHMFTDVYAEVPGRLKEQRQKAGF